MKQLALTPELKNRLSAALGPDAEIDNLTVFEAIALNTKPLPGKGGTIFENATVPPLTLVQMADFINAGNHIPLISDHQLSGEPKGRMFAADLNYTGDGTIELRALFYLDPTEDRLIQKLNAGSLDEVSVAFLSSQLICSECGWDYFANATADNLVQRVCANGHAIGQDGVHAELVGLNQFIELSLVSRGAADKPKIVGKSESKFQPPNNFRLAARGFDVGALVFQGSAGEEVVTIDTTKLMTDLVDSKTQVATLTAEKSGLEVQLSAANTAKDSAEAKITTLTQEVNDLQTQLTAAKAEPGNAEDYALALSFLEETAKNVLTAAGADVPAEMPKTAAELKTIISEKITALKSVLPIGGVAADLRSQDESASRNFDAFKTR